MTRIAVYNSSALEQATLSGESRAVPASPGFCPLSLSNGLADVSPAQTSPRLYVDAPHTLCPTLNSSSPLEPTAWSLFSALMVSSSSTHHLSYKH